MSFIVEYLSGVIIAFMCVCYKYKNPAPYLWYSLGSWFYALYALIDHTRDGIKPTRIDYAFDTWARDKYARIKKLNEQKDEINYKRQLRKIELEGKKKLI